VTVLNRSSAKSLVSKSSSASTTWGNLLPNFEAPVNQTPSRQLFAACKNRPRARASRSRCPLHRKRESRHHASGCKIARIRLHDAHIRFLFSFIFRLGVWLCQESAACALHAYPSSSVEAQAWVARGAGRHWPQGLGRAAEVRWLSTRRRRGIASRRSPRQWPVTGKFHGDGDRQVLAGLRPSSPNASGLIPHRRSSTSPAVMRCNRDYESRGSASALRFYL
jgi:hypothetical protein